MLRPDESRRIQVAGDDDQPIGSARDWLRSAHAQLADLLPKGDRPTLLTEDMTGPDGEPLDVFAYFGVNPNTLQSLVFNYYGMKCTANGASQDLTIDAPPPTWPGFDDVWLEMPDGVKLAARLGFAKSNNEVHDADCIVLLPGFFGDNGVVRTRDLAEYLVGSGFHVLALEMRGHGQTERTQPDVAYTFGVRETDDLMHVADWLQDQPHVKHTGLIGFCWSANTALLAAWFANRRPDDPNITPTIATQFYAEPGVPRFQAGVMAFSPIPQWEHLVDLLEKDYSLLGDPVYATLQNTNRERMERKNYPNPNGSLRELILREYDRCGVMLPGGIMEGYLFLRLAPYDNRPFFPKLDRIRVPVVMVHAANDPLSPAQDVADLLSRESNPLVAGEILAGGGHVGFATYAREYYFSLIASFFDPEAGAAAAMDASLASPVAKGVVRANLTHAEK
ncbi:MAG: alpha/beta fold hydrolase [Phycisphaerales bacterium]|nr:alpha/beta fold hydrolase [Phycisphaerales bacterium]